MTHETPDSGTSRVGSRDDEMQVRDLIVEAGNRPDLPADDLQAIRDAARAEWTALVEQQQGRVRREPRRIWALAASLLMVVAAAWWWAIQNSAIDPAAAVIVAVVERVDGGDADSFVPGTEIQVGDAIETPTGLDGEAHRLALRLASGASLRVDSQSRLSFVADDEIELRRGAIYLDTGQQPSADGTLTVNTELGSVRHVGTQYEVRLLDYEEAVRIRVREGEVALESVAGPHRIRAGEQLEVGEDGRVVDDAIQPYESAWDWVSEIAPAIEIDDLPILSYLEWLARESGREIVFESAGVESYAAQHTITLPTEGLTPMQSLDAARIASKLVYEAENGSILVRSP